MELQNRCNLTPGSGLRRNTGDVGGQTRIYLPDGEWPEWDDISGRDQRSPETGLATSQRSDRQLQQEYGCTRLVWYEAFDDIQQARQRELQMKKWKRAWKVELIERDNPQWLDLFDRLSL